MLGSIGIWSWKEPWRFGSEDVVDWMPMSATHTTHVTGGRVPNLTTVHDARFSPTGADGLKVLSSRPLASVTVVTISVDTAPSYREKVPIMRYWLAAFLVVDVDRAIVASMLSKDS